MADAPSQLIAELLGESFIRAVERNHGQTVERLRRLWRWLCDVAEPPSATRLSVLGGSVHTGIAIVERNRVVVLIGVRHGRGASQREYPEAQFHMHDDPHQQWLDEGWPPGHYPPERHYSPVR